jgi:hypothetical protein
MELTALPGRYSVCRLRSLPPLPSVRDAACRFLSITPDEISWVGPEAEAPADAEKTEAGWRALRVAGTLDFALTGILARLTRALADAAIPVFAVSTHDTDYLLVREAHWAAACAALEADGYRITEVV